jgi:hypothetical protein
MLTKVWLAMNERHAERHRRKKLLLQRRAIAAQQQPRAETLDDPIEHDAALREILLQADALAEAALRCHPVRRGSCHLLWKTKQRILLEQFAIDWFTPAEMNPDFAFD